MYTLTAAGPSVVGIRLRAPLSPGLPVGTLFSLCLEATNEGQDLRRDRRGRGRQASQRLVGQSKVHVRRTNTALKRLRNKGEDALTGRTVTRHGVGIAISVWYDEHPAELQIRIGWAGRKAGK